MSASSFKAACYAATPNLYGEMCAAAKSLLAHTAVDRIFFLSEHDVFPLPLPEIVTNVNVRGQPFFRPDGPNFRCGWTHMLLMKAALHRLFPELERILMLDVDTFVLDDVSALWELDLGDNFLAGAVEPLKSRPGVTYINAGVMMLNLAKLREGKGDELIASLNERVWDYCEQDAIAGLCQGGILEIPSAYNANAFTKPTGSPKIVHYAAVYEWMKKPIPTAWKAAPWPEQREKGGVIHD